MILDTISCKTKSPLPGTGYLPSTGAKETEQKKNHKTMHVITIALDVKNLLL